jgi:DNA-binding winged helix-turn-helix (wHTH) protein
MRYQLGPYILDTTLRKLTDAQSGALISENDRLILVLKLLAEQYPDHLSKESLIKHLWPEEAVSDWALSRLIADLRSLLANGGQDTTYIRTLRGKGFRLAVPVTPLSDGSQREAPVSTTPDITVPVITAPGSTQQRPLRYGLAALLVCLLLLASGSAIYLTHQPPHADANPVVDSEFLPRLPIETTLIPARTLALPVDSRWLVNDELLDETPFRPAIFDLQPGKHIYTTLIQGPLNLQGAKLVLRIKVDQQVAASHFEKFILFAQSFVGSWPGEWDCNFADQLKVGEQELSCEIQEPGVFFLLGESDYSRIGIQTLGAEVSGQLEILSASIELPASLPLDHHWRLSHKGPLQVDQSLHIPLKGHITSVAYDIAGPLSLQNTAIAMTLKINEDVAHSIISIQPFVQRTIDDWSGHWNCLITADQLTTEGDTYYCEITHDYVDIAAGEYLQIGLHAKGRNMTGHIQLMGVNILQR